MNSQTLPIKGWGFYQGPHLWQTGKLQLTSSLSLQAEPDNPFDRYAVQVYLNLTPNLKNPNTHDKALIGYLPRESAAFMQYLLLQQQIKNIKISQTKTKLPYQIILEIDYQDSWWHKLYFPIWKLLHPQHKIDHKTLL